MKRLIDLTAVLTLLASLSGCSILGGGSAQSCNAPSPTPSFSRLGLPRLSLPWRRGNQGAPVEMVGYGADCPSCNAGMIEGVPVASVGSEPLYDPGSVFTGPVYESGPTIQTRAPMASPEMGLPR